MMRRMNGAKGFTLIELMIVVAIIGILAAIAIPNFVAMQLRSKRSELPTNLDGLRTAELAYQHEWDFFTTTAPTPGSVPGKTVVTFGHSYGDKSAWDLLGWMPDGMVRAQYKTTALNPEFFTGLDEGEPVSGQQDDSISTNFVGEAVGDIDGDGTNAKYSCSRVSKPVQTTPNSVY